MSTAVKPLRVGGLPVLAFTAVGSVFFAYALYLTVRPLLLWPKELSDERLGILSYLSFPCAALVGLALELRSFARLVGKVETSARN